MTDQNTSGKVEEEFKGVRPEEELDKRLQEKFGVQEIRFKGVHLEEELVERLQDKFGVQELSWMIGANLNGDLVMGIAEKRVDAWTFPIEKTDAFLACLGKITLTHFDGMEIIGVKGSPQGTVVRECFPVGGNPCRLTFVQKKKEE